MITRETEAAVECTKSRQCHVFAPVANNNGIDVAKHAKAAAEEILILTNQTGQHHMIPIPDTRLGTASASDTTSKTSIDGVRPLAQSCLTSKPT